MVKKSTALGAPDKRTKQTQGSNASSKKSKATTISARAAPGKRTKKAQGSNASSKNSKGYYVCPHNRQKSRCRVSLAGVIPATRVSSAARAHSKIA